MSLTYEYARAAVDQAAEMYKKNFTPEKYLVWLHKLVEGWAVSMYEAPDGNQYAPSREWSAWMVQLWKEKLDELERAP